MTDVPMNARAGTRTPTAHDPGAAPRSSRSSSSAATAGRSSRMVPVARRKFARNRVPASAVRAASGKSSVEPQRVAVASKSAKGLPSGGLRRLHDPDPALPTNRNDPLDTDCHPTARARLTLTMRSRADVALQSFLSGSGEAEHS